MAQAGKILQITLYRSIRKENFFLGRANIFTKL
jgi:hypothetical protein